MIWTFLQTNSTALQTIASLLMALTTLGAVLYAIKQVNEAKKARMLSAYLTFESRLTAEQAREDRRYLYEHEFDNPLSITPTDQEILGRVCVTFDILGVLIREDYLYRPLVFKPFYVVIIKCWQRTIDFIEFERKPNRKGLTYMLDFEYLYRQAEEYRMANNLPKVTIHPPRESRTSDTTVLRGRLSTKVIRNKRDKVKEKVAE